MPRRTIPIRWLATCLSIVTSAATAETVATGGMSVTVPDGWARADADGRVSLAPKGLPPGVVCTLTLLGSEAFTGPAADRMAADWKDIGSVGKLAWDDEGKVDGAGGAVQVASRAGTFVTPAKAEVHVWLVNVHTGGRVGRLVFVASTRDAFAKHVAGAGAAVNSVKLVPADAPPAPAVAKAAAEPKAAAFGHARYTIPAGWRETRYTNGVILSPADPPAGESLELLLLSSTPASGTLAKALETAWDDECTRQGATKKRTVNNTPYDAAEARTSFKGWEYIRGAGVVTANADQAEYALEMFVLKVNDRFERVAVLSRIRTHNLSRYSLSDSRAYRQTVRAIVFGMTFDDWTDTAVKPAGLDGGGVVGVWQGISMFGGQFKAAYVILYSNGQAFFGSRFPLDGCGDGQDTWVEAEETPRYWGTYTFADGAGALRMPYGEVPIRSKATGLVFTTNKTDHAFVRVPDTDGARFDGTYVLPEHNGKVPTITFTPDGKFRDDGALKVLDHEIYTAFAASETPGAGTYAVRGHTVTFRYDDGRIFRLAFPGADYEKGNPTPARLTLSFNEDTLTRK